MGGVHIWHRASTCGGGGHWGGHGGCEGVGGREGGGCEDIGGREGGAQPATLHVATRLQHIGYTHYQ